MGSFQRNTPLQAGLEQCVERTAGQQRSFHWPSRVSRFDHLLDSVKEERKVGTGPSFLGPELAGFDRSVGILPGSRPFACRSVQLDYGGLEAVRIVQEEKDRPSDRLLKRTGTVEMAGQSVPSRLKQFGRDPPLSHRLPDGLIREALDRRYSRFAALTLLGQRLDCFERMEPVAVCCAIGNHHDGLEKGTPPNIGGRFSPRDGNRTAGHERNVQCLRFVVDGFGIAPVVGQMLVHKNGHDAAGAPEDGDGFIPEPAFRISGVAGGRAGVVAVFGDEKHAFYGKGGTAEGQRLANGIENWELIGGG